MITITNGLQTFKVTEGAFKNIFKAQGYFKADEQEKAGTSIETSTPTTEPTITNAEEITLPSLENPPEDENQGSVDEPEEMSEDLSEIPLSEMTNKQLTAYAAQLGVDIKGVKSKKVVIDRIRAAL